jgi:mycoredoxin
MNDLYSNTPSIIVAYMTPFCPDCIQARQYFKQNGIEFLDININKDPQAAEFIAQVNNGCRSVPTIVFPNGDILVEPSIKELASKASAL